MCTNIGVAKSKTCAGVHVIDRAGETMRLWVHVTVGVSHVVDCEWLSFLIRDLTAIVVRERACA